MAKAKEITGLDCAANALDWAATVLQVRFDEVVELRGGALNFSDIEGVHAMRVATRRLRSALRDFEPLLRKRAVKNVRKDLKKLADALGAVRDQDVAILALENLQIEAATEQIKNGIGQLLEERRTERETARMDLLEALAISNITILQENFTTALEKAVKQKKQSTAISFNQAGHQAVSAALAEFCDLGASIYEPFKIEALHEMRIAAKRLRYAVELFTACWGERITPFAEEIAEMQGFLGEVHDCDVWIENLGKRLGGKGQNGAANQNTRSAEMWLLSEFSKKRNKNYRSALQLWADWEANDFTGRLKTLMTENAA